MCDLWMDVDAALSEVPVNLLPLCDDTDFKSREESVAYNAAGLELIWHFTTTAGATTATVVTPTTGGAYDWAHQDGGMYTIEMPASGGASANNDTEGFGWFTGVATGVLPWRGPVIGFRAAALNDALIDGGDSLDVNVTAISGDTTAADNCELMFDGTGYAGGTTKLGVDAVAISGDTTAANNLEAACDGTGYNIGGGDVVAASVTAGVTLANDAITAAKYDQSTAFPLTAADGSDLTACATATGFSTHSAADVKTAIEAAGSHLTLIKAKTDNLPSDPADQSAVEAAITAAHSTTNGKIDAVDDFVDTEVAAILAAVDTEVAAIKAKTDNLPASPAAVGSAMTLDAAETGTGLTAVPWNASWDAEVQSECADALSAYDPPTATEMTSAFTEIKGATWSSATDTLEAIRDRGDSAWTTATGFATASDITTAHSTTDGKIDAVDDYVDTEVTAIKAVTDKLDTALELDGAVYRYTTNALEQAPSGGLDAAGVRTAVGLASANLDTQLGALPTAAENADAAWNETVADHPGVGSTGAALAAAGGSGDPWSTAIPGSYAAGTAGQIVGDNVDGLAALIGSGGITVVSPVSEDGGTITIVQGDDYNASDGRALEWSSDNWPDITGAAITLYIEDSGGTYSEAGSVVASGSGTQTVRVEPPNADTTNLDAGFQKFHVEAVLTSSRVVTLATGVAHVIADIS